jgi:hypothetical protein
VKLTVLIKPFHIFPGEGTTNRREKISFSVLTLMLLNFLVPVQKLKDRKKRKFYESKIPFHFRTTATLTH